MAKREKLALAVYHYRTIRQKLWAAAQPQREEQTHTAFSRVHNGAIYSVSTAQGGNIYNVPSVCYSRELYEIAEKVVGIEKKKSTLSPTVKIELCVTNVYKASEIAREKVIPKGGFGI